MKLRLFPQNREGWIRIVEAFVAVLLIAGVVLVILDKGYIGKEDSSGKIYELESSILREIQLNNTLRENVLNSPGLLPINYSNVNFPISIKNKIENKIPAYLECKAKICSIDDDCFLDEVLNKDIYVKSVAITSTLTQYNPRQLKMFCWMKN